MRTIHVCVIATTAAVLGSLATLAAQKQIQKSTVFEWAALEAKPTPTGSRRDVLRAPTPTLEELEIHITTLDVNQVSHPPHQHPEEELLIVKEGMSRRCRMAGRAVSGRGRSSSIPRTISTTFATPEPRPPPTT